jgi:hypothetical protein
MRKLAEAFSEDKIAGMSGLSSAADIKNVLKLGMGYC